MTKVFLQNDQQLFAGNNGDWTTDEQQARDFGKATSALNFCNQEKLSNISVVIIVHGERYALPFNSWD